MGDPKRSRKKYSRPLRPWEGDRIKEENELKRKYGLKNKKEIWKARSILKRCRGLARDQGALIRAGNEQAKKESVQLLNKLVKLGILEEDSQLDQILALNVERILSRRLQTLVYEKGLAYTPKQARQFITHGHISINGRKMNVPGFLVPMEDELNIEFSHSSALTDESHPMKPQSNYMEIRKRKEEKEKDRLQRMESRGRRGGAGGRKR